jgi:hypothetical protein
LNVPDNGFIIGGICSRNVGNICLINCKIGYKLKGSIIHECVIDKNRTEENKIAYWSGIPTKCES